MKVSVAREDLLESLSLVNRGLSSRSTLPILSSILLSANGDRLDLQATDLEVSIKHSTEVRVDEPGQAVVPGRLLTDIVRSLPEAAVTLEASGTAELTVSCDHASFKVRTLSPEDFPRFPEVEASMTAILPVSTVGAASKQVARAASRDETRPVLTGVLTTVEANHLRMVATDSYRLAVRELNVEGDVEDFEVVLPSKAVEEIPKLAGSTETVSIGVSENQVVFTMGDTVFVSRRIEGKFPNYRQLIPADATTKMTIETAELLDAVKRVAILAQQNVPMRVKVSPSESTLELSATTQDVGEAKEALMVQAEGEEVEIAFNASFLVDGLTASGAESVSLEITSPLKPGVLRSVGDEEYTYILMPVRIG